MTCVEMINVETVESHYGFRTNFLQFCIRFCTVYAFKYLFLKLFNSFIAIRDLCIPLLLHRAARPRYARARLHDVMGSLRHEYA